MERRQDVLVLEIGGRGEDLSGRLLLNHFRARSVSTIEEAEEILTASEPLIQAALLPSQHGLPDLVGTLNRLRAVASSGHLSFVMVGKRPRAQEIDNAKSAGVEVALFEPFTDPELRFILNDACHDPALVSERDRPRVPCDVVARVLSSTGEKVAPVYNISEGGAYLETSRPAQVSAKVDVELRLPTGAIRVAATVVSTNVPGNLMRPQLPLGMGVQFQDVDHGVADTLRRYIEDRAGSYQL